MNLSVKATTSISKNSTNLDLPISQFYNSGMREVSSIAGNQLYQQLIPQLRTEVSAYRVEFEQKFEAWARGNSVLKKMRDSLNPGARSSDTILISPQKIQNNKKVTKELISTMSKGHDLLLNIRKRLSGQEINTKVIISYNGSLYQVSEKTLKEKGLLKYVLSDFGGGAVSNPFSVAYQLNLQALKDLNIFNEENDITRLDVYQTIMKLKIPYLREKTLKTGRYYQPYFDSKDAGIVELYQQQVEKFGSMALSFNNYKNYRTSMGGGGGYRTPFYKMGDIGATQVKFFSFKRNAQIVNINFGRFSLLRDRFRDLERILNQNSESQIIQGLTKFFTDNTENLKDIDIISQEFNKIAQELIFQNLTL